MLRLYFYLVDRNIYLPESLQPPNVDCSVCSVARCILRVDIHRLTLEIFINEILKGLLDYSDEVSVMTSKLLYDVEFDDNLKMTFEELGIGDDSFVTVIDEDDEEYSTPRVNVEFIIHAW